MIGGVAQDCCHYIDLGAHISELRPVQEGWLYSIFVVVVSLHTEATMVSQQFTVILPTVSLTVR